MIYVFIIDVFMILSFRVILILNVIPPFYYLQFMKYFWILFFEISIIQYSLFFILKATLNFYFFAFSYFISH